MASPASAPSRGPAPAPPPPSAARPSPRTGTGGSLRTLIHRWDHKAAPYAFVAPFFALFAAFGIFPLLYTAWVSLHRVELQTSDRMDWLGLQNYTRLLDDPFFWNALRNTFTIGVLSTVPQLLMALGLAHLLNYRLRGRTFFRVAMLMPYATSVAAATLVFAQLFGHDYGLINWVLSTLGLHPVDWQAGTVASQIGVSTIVTWRWTGYNALIYLAGMQSIPAELYESAAIDGASRWQQFRHVTVPGLRPTILFTGGGFAHEPASEFASLSLGKAALRSLTYTLAQELGASGIHVATVTVYGFVQTGTKFDPQQIARVYLELHKQPKGHFDTERIFK